MHKNLQIQQTFRFLVDIKFVIPILGLYMLNLLQWVCASLRIMSSLESTLSYILASSSAPTTSFSGTVCLKVQKQLAGMIIWPSGRDVDGIIKKSDNDIEKGKHLAAVGILEYLLKFLKQYYLFSLFLFHYSFVCREHKQMWDNMAEAASLLTGTDFWNFKPQCEL